MSVSLTVMTFNLHEDPSGDGPNVWEKRRDLCVRVITSYSPIILCTQQGVKSQLEFLQQALPGYDQFGISRKGSQDISDERCTIFYDKEKVELLEGGTFWLSESPSVPGSMSWGSEVPCIATWATFQLKSVEPPGFTFQIVNTSMDEYSPRARRRSALLTWQHIASLPPNLPVIYCGGFNTQKESTTGRFLLGRSRFQLKSVEPPGFTFQIVNTSMDEYSPRARRRSALLTWQHIASLPPNLPVIYCGGFNTQKESTTGRFLLGRSSEHGVVGDMGDAWPNARVRKNVSLVRTYHGFKGDKQGALEFLNLIFRALCLCWDRQTQDLHVDWVLYRGGSLIPVSCEVVNDNVDGLYPSSHYPVFAEFMLPPTVRLLENPEGS